MQSLPIRKSKRGLSSVGRIKNSSLYIVLGCLLLCHLKMTVPVGVIFPFPRVLTVTGAIFDSGRTRPARPRDCKATSFRGATKLTSDCVSKTARQRVVSEDF